MSRLLSGQQEFSIAICKKIISKLQLSNEEQKHFTKSVSNAKKRMAEDLFVNAFSSDEPDTVFAEPGQDNHIVPKWLLGSSSNIVIVVNEEGKIIHTNDKGKVLAGLKVPEVMQEHFTQAFLSKQEHKAEVFIRCPDRNYWFETIFTPMLNKWGKISNVASLSYDITDKKRVESRLQYMNMMSGILLDQKVPFSAFRKLVEYTALHTDTTDACIFLYIDEKQDQILCYSHRDEIKKGKIQVLLSENQEGLNSLLSIPQKKAVLFSNARELETYLPKVVRRDFLHDLDIGSLIYVPLLDGSNVVGALFFMSGDKNAYDESDRDFAYQIGLRASHMLIYQKLLKQDS